MSYDYSKRVWATDLKGGKLLVMLALAQHAGTNGECYPGADTLAAMARLTDRQVRRVLNELEKSGHIVIEQRAIGRGKKPSYKLFPEAKADKMSDQSVKAEEMSDLSQESGQNVHLLNEKADISDNKSGHFDTIKADISEPIQSHARSESHLESQELTEKEEKAREPLAVAWQQAYEAEMPKNLVKRLNDLAIECSVAAAIHGIKASAAKEGGRNFKYIAECARNYVPPPPKAEYAASRPYSNGVPDLPGVYALQPAVNGHEPPLPAPMPHDDPWAIALAELQSANLPWAHWLDGSFLQANGEIAGEPLYRVVLTEPRADAQWMTAQAEPAIRRKLASVLRKRISLEITVAERTPA